MQKKIDNKLLKYARDKFDYLLKTKTREADWQIFFAEHPFVLSESLPLKLSPSDISPLGRPGKSEPDFIFYPKKEALPSFYGVIEIKRPDTRIFVEPRKNILALSADLQTAFAQAKYYANQLERNLFQPDYQTLSVGNERYVFIISGLSSEIASTATNDILRDQMKQLLPGELKLFTYDHLYKLFTQKVPPQLFFLVDSSNSLVIKQKLLIGYVQQDKEFRNELLIELEPFALKHHFDC